MNKSVSTRAAVCAVLAGLAVAGSALAQDAGPVSAAAAATVDPAPASDTSVFIFNTLLFLIMGMVVMFMSAGFCMLETGLVRAKNAATISLKNIALYAIAGMMTWAVGYNLIYSVAPGGFLAPLSGLFFWTADDTAPSGLGYAANSGWFFQMVFVATSASIVSGALAERIKLWPFLIFSAVLTGVIYPVQASWSWGKGFMHADWYVAAFGAPFADFAGSTIVHATGGFAALTGALLLGARKGKYVGGQTRPMPGSNLPLAALGAFILWLGWFGFNGGSQLALGSISDAVDISTVIVNTNMSACGGLLVAMLLTQILYKKVDLTIALNGAIGGLVAITAGPLTPSIAEAVLIGGVGGVIVTVGVPMLDALRIDDVVGAIPAHLFCGIWGTLIVPWSNPEANFLAQLIGILCVGVFVTVVSGLVWILLKYTVGIRAREADEQEGLDLTELGLEAYPEFLAGGSSVTR